MKSPDKNIRLFTEIYKQNYTAVFGAAYARLHDVDAAKDICQEVFIRFYSKMNEEINPRQWLYSAVRYVVLEYLRKNNHGEEDIIDLDDSIAHSFVNGYRESRIIIEEALNDIAIFGDDLTKTLYDLVAVYHYTYKEAGERIGISERQAKYRYQQTVHRLVDHLRTKGIRGLEDLL